MQSIEKPAPERQPLCQADAAHEEMAKLDTRKAFNGRKAAAGSRRPSAGAVRIIGGEWRRRRIAFPGVEHLRPTPDRVRETLFNWLGQRLPGLSCLDLFAGSGALGIEAASRGAALVTLVEKDRRVVAALHESIRQLGANQVRVVQADALEFLERDASTYELVFVDPPFAEGPPIGLFDAILPRLAAGARVYVESDHEFEAPHGLRLLRHDRAGMVHFHLLQAE
jgi:16S rRNA (guanine966-N2)-methyltransferase